MKVWSYHLADGLRGYRVECRFEVDGILYWPPHIAELGRRMGDPTAPARGTGHVVRRPMIDILLDHSCPTNAAGNEVCEDNQGDLYNLGDAWSWRPRCPTAEALTAGSPLTARPTATA